MKQIFKKALLLMLAACLCFTPLAGSMNTMEVSAAASKAKTGWVTTKKGKKYYYGADGEYKTGWYTIKNKTYFFNAKGVLKPAKTKPIDPKLVKKMDKAIKSAGVSGTTEKLTALKFLFNYVSNFNYGRVYGFDENAKGWEYDSALYMLTQKQGSCFHYAAAFAFLAKRATGYPVRIGWGDSSLFKGRGWQRHAWAEVKINGKWYTFDTNSNHNIIKPTGTAEMTRTDWYMQRRELMIGKYYRSNPQYVNVEI